MLQCLDLIAIRSGIQAVQLWWQQGRSSVAKHSVCYCLGYCSQCQEIIVAFDISNISFENRFQHPLFAQCICFVPVWTSMCMPHLLFVFFLFCFFYLGWDDEDCDFIWAGPTLVEMYGGVWCQMSSPQRGLHSGKLYAQLRAIEHCPAHSTDITKLRLSSTALYKVKSGNNEQYSPEQHEVVECTC